MSNTPGITLTREAQELIVNLVQINTTCKEQKYLLFTKLYDLWEKDLDAGSNPGNKFSDNVDFIKATILNSYMRTTEILLEYIVFLLVDQLIKLRME